MTAGDARGLAARLAGLAADPAGRARMGAAGRSRLLEEFNVERMIARLRARLRRGRDGVKICLINYRYFVSSGPERYLFGVKDLLEERGHEVIPFSVRYRANEPTPWAKYFVEPIAGDDEIRFRQHSWTPALGATRSGTRLLLARGVRRPVRRAPRGQAGRGLRAALHAEAVAGRAAGAARSRRAHRRALLGLRHGLSAGAPHPRRPDLRALRGRQPVAERALPLRAGLARRLRHQRPGHVLRRPQGLLRPRRRLRRAQRDHARRR